MTPGTTVCGVHDRNGGRGLEHARSRGGFERHAATDQAAGRILHLQRAAGNRAVTSMLAATDVIELQKAAGNRAIATMVAVQRAPVGLLERAAALKAIAARALQPKVLRLRDTGFQVTLIQQQLNAHGATLKVDGSFGRITEKALIAFQKSHGLVANGIVTDETRAALLPKTPDKPAGKVGPWGDPMPEKKYPIFVDGKTAMVDEERYFSEGGRLLNKYVALVRAVKEDAVAVLSEYKLAEIRPLYEERMEDLKAAANSLNNGNLVWAAWHLKDAQKYVDIEAKADKMFHDLGVVAYVGKQLDMATIGFFEGAANALLGMVDAAGGVFGFDPGAVAWNTKQYGKIKAGYASAFGGIDPEFTSADEIGRLGGQVAAGVATPKYLSGAGIAGQALLVASGAGGLLKVAAHFKQQHELGKTWSEIFSDPVNMAQAVGAIAGASGLGALAFPSLRTFLSNVGLVASAGQLGVTAGALFRLSQDKTLSSDELRDKTFQLIGDALMNIAVSGEAAAQGRGQGGTSGGARLGAGPGDTLPGTGILPRPPAPAAGDTLPGTGIPPRPPGPAAAEARLRGHTAEGQGRAFTHEPLPEIPDVPTVHVRGSLVLDEGERLASYADALRSTARRNPATAAAGGEAGPYIRDNLYTGSAQKRVVRSLQKHGILELSADGSVRIIDPDRYMQWLERAYRHHGGTHLDPRMGDAIRGYVGGGWLKGVGVNPQTGVPSQGGALPGTHAELLAINDLLISGGRASPAHVATVRAAMGGHFIACLHCGGVIARLKRTVPDVHVWSGLAAAAAP